MTQSVALSLFGFAGLLVALLWRTLRRKAPPLSYDHAHPGRVIPPGTPIRKALREPLPEEPEVADPALRGQVLECFDDWELSTNKTDRPHPLGAASRESEMALLGAMIFDNAVIGDVVEIVNAGKMFAFPAHGMIFEAILRLHLERKPINLVTIRDALARDGHLDAVGGADFLMSLVESVPNTANAPEYARTVREKFGLRILIETCRKIVRSAAMEPIDVDHVFDEAKNVLFQLLLLR